MSGADLILDGFGRVRDVVHHVVGGLGEHELLYRADPEANTICWLIWHLTRVQDDHVAGAGDLEQVWTSQGWYERFGLPLEPGDIGYGHSRDEVAVARAPADLLLGYHDAVYRQTAEFVGGLTDGDMDKVVDTSWDPPVTMAVRLVSVLADDLQHAGQAAFIRGITERQGC